MNQRPGFWDHWAVLWPPGLGVEHLGKEATTWWGIMKLPGRPQGRVWGPVLLDSDIAALVVSIHLSELHGLQHGSPV